MLFNTVQFLLFFCVVVLLHRLLPRTRRNALLLGASLLFYTLWIPSYLLLLLADVGINYGLMRAMRRSARPRLFLSLSIIFTLGLLGTFKYAALAAEALAPILAGGFGLELPIPEFFLPLGISFYSFQIVALMVDVYRRNVEPPESLPRFALFVCFFPQLIAGPILRGNEFLPQLERGGEPTPGRTRRGLWLIGAGLFKKVVMADFLLSSFVEQVFSAPGLGSVGFHVVAIWSFAFQIYFDFSGYSDIARGLALLLGFELPFNFLEPYLSRNPAEFWRRWHITLSTWLRDYLFFPLGGGSRGTGRAALGLFVTMVLGGLWHGAVWTFALWGAYHGVLLALHRLLGPSLGRISPRGRWGRWLWSTLSVFVTFHLICIGLILFRAPSFDIAWQFVLGIFAGHDVSLWPIPQLLIVLFCMALHFVERVLRVRRHALQASLGSSRVGAVAEGFAFATMAALVLATSGVGGEFIYFQF